MIRYISLLLLIGLVWGQALHFKNNDETIKIDSGEKLQLNEDKYTLVKTDYSKKYVLVEKHNSSIQDTLRFGSIVSFKYYEKSLRSFASSVVKGTAYGALFGASWSVVEGEIKYGFNPYFRWTILYSKVYGSFGSIGGAIYGILIPIASEQIILEKEGWYISE